MADGTYSSGPYGGTSYATLFHCSKRAIGMVPPQAVTRRCVTYAVEGATATC
jgi:hypothetical protein